MIPELAAPDVESLFADAWSDRLQKLRPGGDAPLFDERMLFGAFLRAAEHEGEGRVFFNREIEGGIYNRQAGAPTPREAIPRAEDGDFVGYAARMEKELGGHPFCLRLVDAQVYGHELFERLGLFTRPLREKVARLDPTPRGIQATVFVGNYDYSPFGAHADGVPQFQYLVRGSRRAYFWLDKSYWRGKSHDEMLEPWKHLEHATAVDLAPGDLVYWPEAAEHVFQCKGGTLAVAVTFTFLPRPPAESDVEVAARRSAHDFRLFPPQRQAPALDRRTVLRGVSPVSAHRLGPGSQALLANGFIISLEGRVALDGLLARVQSGKPFTLDDEITNDPALSEAAAVEVASALVAAWAVDAAR